MRIAQRTAQQYQYTQSVTGHPYTPKRSQSLTAVQVVPRTAEEKSQFVSWHIQTEWIQTCDCCEEGAMHCRVT